MIWFYAFRMRKAGILEERSGLLLVLGLWVVVNEGLNVSTWTYRGST